MLLFLLGVCRGCLGRRTGAGQGRADAICRGLLLRSAGELLLLLLRRAMKTSWSISRRKRLFTVRS